MEKRVFGKTGLRVSVLGFGGAEIGFEKASTATVSQLLNEALDAGLNVIDTAECYEQSEELIGEAVSSRRQDYHLFTKCGHPDGIGRPDWSRASILKSIERSLRRLRTDHVDLVLLHSCGDTELRQGEVIEALQEARSRGHTRFIGYSGDGATARYAVETGQFDVLEISVNVADQEAIDLTLPLAVQTNMGVIAKRPIANAAWKTGARPVEAYHHTYWERLRKLNYDFMGKDLPKAVGIALRFTLGIPGVHVAIVGTTRPGRWRENAALIAEGPLPAEQVQSLRERWKAVADASWVGQV